MGYAQHFLNLKVGSGAFDMKWKQLASDPAFGDAQHEYIRKQYYIPQLAYLKKRGIDLISRGPAVQDSIWSTAVQFGPNTSLITKALAGMNLDTATDAEIVSAIQDYKVKNNNALFKSSSPAVRESTLNRAKSEKADLLALCNIATMSEKPPVIQMIDNIIDGIQGLGSDTSQTKNQPPLW